MIAPPIFLASSLNSWPISTKFSRGFSNVSHPCTFCANMKTNWGVPHPRKSAVGQQQESRRSQCCRPSVFVKLHFVWLLGLPGTMQTGVDVWRGSGGFWLSSGTGQGTKVLSYYVLWLVSHTGAVLSSSHDCILTRLGRLRSSFWKSFLFSMVSYKGLSSCFFFLFGGLVG